MEVENMRNFIADRLGGRGFSTAPQNYKFERIKEAKRHFQREFPAVHILDFGIGEPAEDADVGILSALKNAANEPGSGHYTDCGSADFIDVARQYMAENFGISLAENEILPSIGTKSALGYLALALINPGEIVLTTAPGYPVFATHASYLGGKIYPLPLRPENHYLPDFSTIPSEILQQAKVLHLNYPNNPTGVLASAAFFQKAIDFAKKYGLAVINDAAYGGLHDEKAPPISLLSIPGAMDCALELHSCSKTFAMTGWRMGWVCGNTLLLRAYRQIKDCSDSGQFLPIQRAAKWALQSPQLRQNAMKRYHARADQLQMVLEKMGFQFPLKRHPFYLYSSIPKGVGEKIFSSAEDFAQWLLLRHGVLTVPWDEEVPGIRFSMTFSENPEAMAKTLQERLKNVLFSW